MKKFRLLLLIIITMFGVLALGACSLPQLLKPRGLHYNDETSKLEWLAVEGARSYIIEVNNTDDGSKKEEGWRSASFDLSGYPSGNYSIRVKAVGDKYNNSDSVWSDPIKIKRYYQSGLALRLIESGTAYEVTGIGSAGNQLIIPSDYRDIPITKIGDGAFNNCNRLRSVVIPETITYISDRAFRNCGDLETIEFSDKITHIGKSAFQGCSALIRVNLPEELVSIDDSAFAYCSRLSEINFNSKITSIGEMAFRGTPIEELTIPDSITKIGNSAFAYCAKLAIVNIGKNVVTIGGDAFRHCNNLKAVYFDGPDWTSKVNTIEAQAFAECTSLKSITIPDSVITIGAYAFSKCTALATVKLSRNLSSLGRSAFTDTDIWAKTNAEVSPIVYVDDWVVGCKDFQKDTLEIDPAKNIRGIADYSFHTTLVINKDDDGYKEYNHLEDITIPASVRVIGANAFKYCVVLTKVHGCEGLWVIDESAFNGCEKLQEMSFGKELKLIGNYAFADCERLGIPTDTNDANELQDVDIPLTLETMGMNPFENTHIWKYYEGKVVYAGGWVVGLNGVGSEDVVIEDATWDSNRMRKDIIGVANYACYGANMKTLDLPVMCTRIGESAFANCSNLETITVNGSEESGLPKMTSIAPYTFYQCPKLNITIKNSDQFTTIGTAAFYRCESLKSNNNLDLSNTTYIGDSAFFGTKSLVKVTFSEKLTYLGVRAFFQSGIENANLPASLSAIGDYAFSSCPYLKNVEIENKVIDGAVKGVETIGKYAFSASKVLRQITIPGSVKKIDDYAFRNCTGLTKVTFEEGVESLGYSSFAACENLKNLSFPGSLKSIGNLCFRGCTSLGSVILRSTIENMGMHVFYGCNPAPKANDEASGDGQADAASPEDGEESEEPEEEEIIEKVGGFTIYTDMTSIPESWSIRWNTARSPIIFGCELDVDNDGAYYVVSFTKNSNAMTNVNSKSFAGVPTRAGFECIGFSTVPNGVVEYDSVDLMDISDGVTLYPVWINSYN